MHNNVGFQHFHLGSSHKNSKSKTKSNSALIKLMDKLVYVLGISGIAFTIPQLTKIWINQQVEGLSLVTWVGFWIGTVFWLFYGILHKAKPIIFLNLAYGIIYALIVIGIIIFKR